MDKPFVCYVIDVAVITVVALFVRVLTNNYTPSLTATWRLSKFSRINLSAGRIN